MNKKNTKNSKLKKPIEHIKCFGALICTLSSIDITRNNISLFDVIEQVNVPSAFFKQTEKTPLIMFPHEIILFWRRLLDTTVFDEEISADLKVSTIDPSEKILQELLIPIKIPKGKRRLKTKFGLNVLALSTVGDYIYAIDIKFQDAKDFKRITEIPFQVLEMPEPSTLGK